MLDRRSTARNFGQQPARCLACFQPVTLHVLEAMLITLPRQVPWVCPYCQCTNVNEVTGRLALVSRGHPDPDPERPPDSMSVPPDVHPTSVRCPECRVRTGRLLKFASERAWVLYYRCGNCSYVWTTPKPATMDPQQS